MTAPEAAEVAQMLLNKPDPSPNPLAEETLASNEAWKALWAEPVTIPPVPRYCDGPEWDQCIPAPRELVDHLLDKWHGEAVAATYDSPWWAQRRGRRLAVTAAAIRPEPLHLEPLPRFVPADDTSVDLPAIGELDEHATEVLDRYLEAHDEQAGPRHA